MKIPTHFYVVSFYLATAATNLAQNAFPSSGSAYISGDSTRLGFASATNIERVLLFGDGGGGNDYGFGIDSTDLVANFGAGGGMTFKSTGILGAPLMRILGSGNVGIGTTNPSSLLHLASSSSIDLKMISTASGGYSRLFFGAGTNGVRWNVGQRDDTGGIFSIEGASTVSGGWGSRLAIALNGNVGIGTTNPGYRLDVVNPVSDGNAANLLRLQSPSVNGARMNFVSTSANGRDYGVGSNYVLGNGEFAIYDYTVSASRMLVDSSGNVGIGTTNPTEKLSVNGKIRAKEVIVETSGWSDHVFADSYQLASLSEVEQHIKTEKHLPGVPSAQEVAAKGVSVGDMQALLLAKIEELTLHQIAQEKRLDAQQAEIATLKAENARLKILEL